MRSILALGLLALVAAAATAQPANWETPPIALTAAALLPAEALASAHYRVLDRVENDGFMNRWTIESDWGEFEAESDALLRVRLREIVALTEIAEVTRSQAFADAFEQAFVGKWRAARIVVEHPVETAKRVPAGVARLFRRTVRRARNLSEKVEEEYHEQKEDAAERKAKRAEEAVAREAESGGEPDPELERAEKSERRRKQLGEAKEVATDVGEEVLRQLQRMSGYRKARRAWAKSLGVDPYGDNEPLNRELFRVAVASAAGGLPARFAPIPTLPGIDQLGQINSIVYDLDSLDLRLRNEKIFFGLGFTRAEVDPLYDQGSWSDTLITDLADALHDLESVSNLDLLMTWALEAATREEARFQAAVALHLARLHKGELPIAGLRDGGALVIAERSRGGIVIALAVDHLAWTETAESLIFDGLPQSADPDAPAVELHLLGDASPLARRQIAARRVRLFERAF